MIQLSPLPDRMMNISKQSSVWPAGQPATRFAFLLVPQFALMSFCSCCEPLRVANRLAARTLFRWTLHSVTGEPVISSNGMVSQVDGGIDDIDRVDYLIVVSSFNPQRIVSSQLNKSLRLIASRGTIICGLDTGAYILARAGLLDHHKATIHWEDSSNFIQSFPKVDVQPSRYVMDGKRYTAAGAAASMDLVLEIIASLQGRQLAVQIAEQFIYTPGHRANTRQRYPVDARSGCRHPTVNEAISLMENHLEDTLSTSQIARLCDISLRQLERLFNTHLGTTPGRWYRQLKLKNARIQLRQSRYTIAEIAANNGFDSSSSFSRAYSAQYHCPPSKDRTTDKI